MFLFPHLSGKARITISLDTYRTIERNRDLLHSIRKRWGIISYIVFRRKTSRKMRRKCLLSNYTVAHYKPHMDKCNELKIANKC